MSPRRKWRWLAVGLLAGLMVAAVLRPPQVAAQEEGRRIKTKVTPAYPALARQMHVAGAVKVQVVISPAGTVKSAKPIGGHPLLIDAAMEAVKRFKYEPAPQETTAVVEFRFNPGT